MSDITTIRAELTQIGYKNTFLQNHFPSNNDINSYDWQLSSNLYYNCSNIDRKIGRKLKSDDSLKYSDKMAEVANLVSFNHFFDAFNYFKSFLKSLLNSDYKVSAHLLYYAELRWLQALLSSQGIISLDRTILVTTDNEIKKLNCLDGDKGGGSHIKLWKLFETWAQLDSATSLVKSTFNVFNHSIHEWLTAGSAPFSTNSYISNWIIDNQRNRLSYFYDRDFRNHVSYKADIDFSAFEQPSISKNIDFLFNEIHDILSFEQDSMFFEQLDKEILCMIVKQQFQQEHSPKLQTKQFFDRACKALGKDLAIGKALDSKIWTSSLLDHKLKGLLNKTNLDSIKFMFYRSLLLMRLASSSLKQNISQSGKSVENFEQWFQYKLKNCPWHDCAKDLFEDALVDYSDNIDSFKSIDLEDILNSSCQSLWELKPNTLTDLLKFTDIEIAAVWSLT